MTKKPINTRKVAPIKRSATKKRKVATVDPTPPESLKSNPVEPLEPQIVDTMGQAEGITGISKQVLKAAKDAGCPAFRGGSRVDLKLLREWLQSNPQIVADSGPELKKAVADARKAMADAEIREHRLAVMRGEYVRVDEVRRIVTRTITEAKSRLTGTAPALAAKLGALSGLDPNKIEPMIADRDRDFLTHMHKGDYAK